MIQYIVIIVALIGIFIFPYPLTAVLTVAAAIASPLAGLALGIITDSVYFTSTNALLPLASIVGLLATLAAFFGKRFVRTHLMQVS
jgi:hypothetical protein